MQSYGLDKGMPNVTPWKWATTGSFFAHMGVQGAGELLGTMTNDAALRLSAVLLYCSI